MQGGVPEGDRNTYVRLVPTPRWRGFHVLKLVSSIQRQVCVKIIERSSSKANILIYEFSVANFVPKADKAFCQVRFFVMPLRRSRVYNADLVKLRHIDFSLIAYLA